MSKYMTDFKIDRLTVVKTVKKLIFKLRTFKIDSYFKNDECQM